MHPLRPRPRSIRALTVAVLLLGGSSLAACGTSGTDLRDPPVGATAPAPTSSTTPTTAAAVFTVFSPAFPMAGDIPATFTCNGEGTSPPITWVGVPPNTVELALTVTTPPTSADGQPIVHWILAGLAPTTVEIPADSVPLDAIEGPNSDGGFGWLPPCVDGDTVSQVQFQLHALEQTSALDPAMPADEALNHLLSLPGTRTISSGTVTANPPTTPPTTPPTSG